MLQMEQALDISVDGIAMGSKNKNYASESVDARWLNVV